MKLEEIFDENENQIYLSTMINEQKILENDLGLSICCSKIKNELILKRIYTKELEKFNIFIRGKYILHLLLDLADINQFPIKLKDNSNLKYSCLVKNGKTFYEKLNFQYEQSSLLSIKLRTMHEHYICISFCQEKLNELYMDFFDENSYSSFLKTLYYFQGQNIENIKVRDFVLKLEENLTGTNHIDENIFLFLTVVVFQEDIFFPTSNLNMVYNCVPKIISI
jgi:hypothetical protein